MKIVLLAGIYNSGAQHWQTQWQAEDARIMKLQHSDWSFPDRFVWVNELDAYLRELKEEIVLVAHSLACLMVAHWASQSQVKVRGALLVSVPDPEGANFPRDASHFDAFPLSPLPFKSIVVASENDPYGSLEHMMRCATAWGSEFKRIGMRGHINADSGLGNWPAGRLLLNELMEG